MISENVGYLKFFREKNLYLRVKSVRAVEMTMYVHSTLYNEYDFASGYVECISQFAESKSQQCFFLENVF